MRLSLQVLSNLHLEINDIINFQNIITPCADVLALQGDIGSPLQTNLIYFIHWCSLHFKYVLYVPGNNEYYSYTGETDMKAINNVLENICDRFSNVFFLNNDTLTIENKYMFIGTTLWSNIETNDCKYIYRAPHQLLTKDDVQQLYSTNKVWVEHQVASAIDSGLIPVVLTHHQPFILKSYTKMNPHIVKAWCSANPKNTLDYHNGYLLHVNKYMNISTLQQEYNYKHCFKIQL